MIYKLILINFVRTNAVLDLDDEDIWVRYQGPDDLSHGHEAGHEDLGPKQIRHQREVPEIVESHLMR